VTTGGTPKRLELAPYTVTNLTKQPAGGNPRAKSSAAGAALGPDAVTSGLTLTGFNGFVEGSRISGDAAAITAIQQNGRHFFQRPDLTSTHLDVARTSLAGYAGALAFNKIGGEYIHSNSYVYLRSPGFDTNDLGFLRRADQIREGHWLQGRSNRVTRWFRQRTINFNQWTSWNFDGDLQFGGGNINGNVSFINNWQAGGGMSFSLPRRGFDDRVTRGGPGISAKVRRSGGSGCPRITGAGSRPASRAAWARTAMARRGRRSIHRSPFGRFPR
jgi:hypothetical protein